MTSLQPHTHINVGGHKSVTLISLCFPFFEIHFILLFFNKPTPAHTSCIAIQFLISSYTLLSPTAIIREYTHQNIYSIRKFDKTDNVRVT